MPLSTYLADKMGAVELSPAGPFDAGSFVSLTLTYIAGALGIDDIAGIKISFRTTSDMGKPRFKDPKGRGLYDDRGSQRRRTRMFIRPRGRRSRKRIRAFRLPIGNTRSTLSFEHPFKVGAGERDTAIYIRVTQDDEHQASSSPIYLIR
jgi:hypothetical protein